MEKLNKLQIAERNKANYLKAKELFNQKKVDEWYPSESLCKN